MCQHPLLWKLNQKFVKYAYAYSTRRLSDEDELLLNFAYDADPPMGLQSEAADERNRGCIQLYYATASQVDLAGKKVLEVGRGYGRRCFLHQARHFCGARYPKAPPSSDRGATGD
jgi:fatty-acid O-methyltransferase